MLTVRNTNVSTKNLSIYALMRSNQYFLQFLSVYISDYNPKNIPTDFNILICVTGVVFLQERRGIP